MRNSKLSFIIAGAKINARDFKTVIARIEYDAEKKATVLDGKIVNGAWKGISETATFHGKARRFLKTQINKKTRKASKAELAFELKDCEGKAPSAPKGDMVWSFL